MDLLSVFLASVLVALGEEEEPAGVSPRELVVARPTFRGSGHRRMATWEAVEEVDSRVDQREGVLLLLLLLVLVLVLTLLQ